MTNTQNETVCGCEKSTCGCPGTPVQPCTCGDACACTSACACGSDCGC